MYDATDAVRDTIYLRAEQTKGNEGNTVYVNKRLAAALLRYAAAYPQRLADPEKALIFSAKGAGFTAQTIMNLFAGLYAAAGISGASVPSLTLATDFP